MPSLVTTSFSATAFAPGGVGDLALGRGMLGSGAVCLGGSVGYDGRCSFCVVLRYWHVCPNASQCPSSVRGASCAPAGVDIELVGRLLPSQVIG